VKFPAFTKAVEGISLPLKAAKVLVTVLGMEVLLGRLPKITELPFDEAYVMEAFTKLSLAGIVLGKPNRYQLARHKLKASESTATHGKQPSLIEILNAYNEEHKHHTKKRPPNDPKALLQIRMVARRYTSQKVKSLIPAFFQAKRLSPSQFAIVSDYCRWLSKHVGKSHS